MSLDGQIRLYASGRWEVDLASRELRSDGVPVRIGSRAFDIMEMLVRSAGEVVTKADLSEKIWPGVTVVQNALEVHVSAIRKSFGSDRGMLKTVSGRGYCLTGAWTPTFAKVPDAAGAAAFRPLPSPFGSGKFPLTESRLFGRTAVIEQLLALMVENRIVTLSGPGGIGKTKLARAVARRALERFPDGGCHVDLVPLSDPRLVPSAVATALGLEFGDRQISSASVAKAIGTRSTLLLLDNCEHVIGAAAELAETIVQSCPHASVLATSRELLRIDDEHVHSVPPLDVPPADEQDAELLSMYSAVQLFTERVRAVRSDFEPDDASVRAMAEICRRLDGIPLAIEFASARASTLGAQWVLSRLNDRFALLNAGRRTSLPRHQTLRATLDWSYELLTGSEQRLFRCLAVFAGGFALEAAVAVLRRAGEASDVQTDLANLVSKSLVVLDTSGAKTRWGLLETVRAYALQKLAENHESQLAARLHAEYFHDLLTSVESAPQTAADVASLARLACDIDNVRAALDWAFAPAGDVSVGVAMTASYVPVWLHLSLVFECRERGAKALAHVDAGSKLGARLMMQLNLAFGVALTHTTPWSVDETKAALSRAFAIAETSGDLPSQLRTLWALWTSHFTGGNIRKTLEVAKKYAQLARKQDNLADILVGDRLMGTTFHYQGRQPEARRHLERVLALYVAPPDQRHTVWFMFDQRILARAQLARVSWLQGFLDDAIVNAKASVEEAQATGNNLSLCYALAEAACPIAIMTGDYSAAEKSVTMLVDVATRHGFHFWGRMGHCLRAKLLIVRGDLAEGSLRMHTALDGFRLTDYANFFGDLAQGLAGSGHVAEGLAMIEPALARSDRSKIRWCLPEVLRIKGELLARDASGQSTESAEGCFLDALEMARQQGALFWEVRVALSLARLLDVGDRKEDAREILSSVYERFVQGFETPDLRSARALLEAS